MYFYDREAMAKRFLAGPMDVFLSWIRLNIRPEKLYTPEQMKAYWSRARLVELPDIESSKGLVDWLNSIALQCPFWAWDNMHILYKEQDGPNAFSVVEHEFEVDKNGANSLSHEDPGQAHRD